MWREYDVKKKNVPVFAIPEDAYASFAELAESEGKTFSQAVRDAMQEYASKRGLQVDFSVGAWGGRRERDAKDEGEE